MTQFWRRTVELFALSFAAHRDTRRLPAVFVVLTRLISEANGVWEYTRFLAERNSVIRDERPEYLVTLPAPAATE